MKDFLRIVNGVVIIGSLIGVVGNLVTAHFGLAWICVIPLAYSLCNFIDDVRNDWEGR